MSPRGDSKADETTSVAVALRGVTHQVALPQGFTLSVTGTFGTVIGQRGFPGPLAVWMFVLGAGLALTAIVIATGAHRARHVQHFRVSGLALINITPLGVVPLASVCSWWIGNDNIALLSAGLAAVSLYLAGTALVVVLLQRAAAARSRRRFGSAGPPSLSSAPLAT